MKELKEQRIEDSLYLLSRGNYWDSIKIVYDVLINEVFLFAKSKKGQQQYIIEEKGKDIMCLLHEFLLQRGVQNINPILSEIRLLTIFYNNYSREALKVNASNHKVQVLTLNLIGLVKYLAQPADGSKYFFGRIDSELITELQNNLTEEIYESTTPYFSILDTSMSLYKENFWSELEKYDPSIRTTVINIDEYNWLLDYRNIIDECQFRIGKEQRASIEDIWKTQINLDLIIEKIKLHYHVKLMINELDNFRKSDKSSGKSNKNIYKQELEQGFHKNIYPFLANNSSNFDLVYSEFNSGIQRHDIVLYKQSILLSAIIELKVNKLDKIENDINQLEQYLKEADEKPSHFMYPPTFGVLAIYYIGEKENLKEIDINDYLKGYNILKHSNNFYLYLPEESKPILIVIYNGKN